MNKENLVNPFKDKYPHYLSFSMTVTLLALTFFLSMIISLQGQNLKKESEKLEQRLTEEQDIQESENINNWKTYTNTEYTFEYPSDWPSPEEFHQSTKYEVVFDTTMFITSGVSYNQDKKGNITFEEWVINNKNTSTDYTLDGLHGKKFSYLAADNKQEIDIAVSESPHSTRIYIITFKYAPGDLVSSTIFDQILSTFKFTDEGNNEEKFCGGIAGIQCPEGYSCILDGNYPDAGGKCFKD